VREDVSSYYDRPEVRAAYRSDGELSRAEELLVDRYVPPGSRVLDVGTGAGRVALALRRRGYGVVGVDISPGIVEEAEQAAERLGIEATFVVADATELPFESDSFDASFFACNGIGHLSLPDMRRALAEMRRVTRSHGHVLLSVRSPYALNRFLPGLVKRAVVSPRSRDELIENGVYVNRPSLRRMRALVRESGLELVTATSLRNVEEGREPGVFTPYLGGQFFLVGRVP
jgi:ubiquinone/menaquinone biosynthesis C-methylase UbiE